MEKAFDYLSVEQIGRNKYKIAGRVLLPIYLGSRLTTLDGRNEIDIISIIYYGKEITELEPMFTCYLMVSCSLELKGNTGIFYKM